MRCARIHEFGPPEVIVIDDIPAPVPAATQVIVEVAAAGVGPWDALVRNGDYRVSAPLPTILGGEVSGMVNGEAVYGATNKELYGAYAQLAIASTATLARKPRALS